VAAHRTLEQRIIRNAKYARDGTPVIVIVTEQERRAMENMIGRKLQTLNGQSSITLRPAVCVATSAEVTQYLMLQKRISARRGITG
jgi:hypothetical protein